MVSFLQKLKRKNINPPSLEDNTSHKIIKKTEEVVNDKSIKESSQLNVDIYQTSSLVIIYSQIAGASINDFSISIEGEGDVVIIKGQSIKPNGVTFEGDGENNEVEHVLEECSWGKFYRQIILPAEVNAEGAEAKMKNGVLTLHLPLKESSDKGVRIEVKEV